MITPHTLNLFPTVIKIYDTDIATEPYRKFVEDEIRVGNFKPQRNTMIWQSRSYRNQDSQIKSLDSFVLDFAQDYALGQCWKIEKTDWYITDSWWNASMGTASTHFSHIHANSLLSVVFYVSMPQGAGSLVFPHPNISSMMIKPDVYDWNIENSLEYSIRPKNGTFVVFKSSTPHLVDNNNSPDLRISIGFTLNIKNLGQYSELAHY